MEPGTLCRKKVTPPYHGQEPHNGGKGATTGGKVKKALSYLGPKATGKKKGRGGFLKGPGKYRSQTNKNEFSNRYRNLSLVEPWGGGHLP